MGGRVIHHNCQFDCQRAAGHEESFFFGRTCKQQKYSGTPACRKKNNNKLKEKRAAGMRCGTTCLRGMQHSLRHVVVRWAVCCVHTEAVAQHPCVGTTALDVKAEAQTGPSASTAARRYSWNKSENKAHTLSRVFPGSCCI